MTTTTPFKPSYEDRVKAKLSPDSLDTPKNDPPPSDEPLSTLIDTFQAIVTALRDGVKYGEKEMGYLYIILVFQISMWVIDLMSPSINEMKQPWVTIFIVFKLIVSLAWIIWGGWLKKQVQTILTANKSVLDEERREWQKENMALKESLNEQSVELQKVNLNKEVINYKLMQTEQILATIEEEKKKYKKLYFELKSHE